MQCAKQPILVKRLHQKVVCTITHRINRDIDGPVGCHNDGLGICATCLQITQQLQTIAIRQLNIQKHQIRRQLVKHGLRFRPCACYRNLIWLIDQVLLIHMGHSRRILDHQKRGHAPSRQLETDSEPIDDRRGTPSDQQHLTVTVYLPGQFLETQKQVKAQSQGKNCWTEEEERRSEQALTCTGASNAAPVAKATLGCQGRGNEQCSYRPWQILELSVNISPNMYLLYFYI